VAGVAEKFRSLLSDARWPVLIVHRAPEGAVP
jgi:hypothetical protein